MANLADLRSPMPVNAGHSLNNALARWWLVAPNRNSGGAWQDMFGRWPGTLTNMAPQVSGFRSANRPGAFGHLVFDGSDDFVSCGTALQITKTTPFSVACWMRSLGSPTNNVLLAQWDQQVTPGWELAVFTAGAAIFGTLSATAGSGCYISGGTINDNVWRHVCGTHDGSNTAAGMSIYVDGVLQTPSVLSNSDPGTLTASDLRIGARQINTTGAAQLPFPGSIDDGRIWTRKLAADEVRTIYALSKVGYPGVLCYPCGFGGKYFQTAAAFTFQQLTMDTMPVRVRPSVSAY